LRDDPVTRRRWSTALIGLALAALAACQPLPHPFADDKPPAALLQVPGSIDISVGNFDGEPRATAIKLSAVTADQLLKHDIAASATAASHSGYMLDGRIEQGPPQAGKATITVFWRLRDAAGKIITEHRSQLSGSMRDWQQGADAQVEQLAATGVDVLASLFTEGTPKQQQQQQTGGRVRVAIRKIAGAPGDGNDSLAASIAAVLKHADVELVDAAKGKPDLDVDANVSIDTKGDKQHVKIVWRVARASGVEIGTVGQENDLPRGRLDGPWGDIAYSVAIAAAGGIMQLVDRGAPPVKLGAAAPPPAPVSPTPPGASQTLPAVSPNSPAAPGNIASPVVNLPPVNVTPDAQADAPVLLPKRGVYLPH
jgi:hypothetical protein